MKYLVVSDSHGDRDIIEKIRDDYKGKVDLLIHCGDSELPADDELWRDFYVVRGNCDFDRGYQTEQLITTENDRIFLTHGHLFMVNTTLTKLGMRAQEEQATMVLFGHTHKQGCEMIGSKLFLNPGSISQPRSLPIKSFAIIESTVDSFDVQYYDRQFIPVETLHFTFKKS